MTFHFGTDPKTELTEDQVIDQCRMYIAAIRIADQFGCAAIGIQYQQGLKDLWPASDLAEGMLNNSDQSAGCPRRRLDHPRRRAGRSFQTKWTNA